MKHKKLISSISQKLRKLREESGLNMKEIAKHLGIERTCYWRYEQGTALPRIDNLCRVGQKLGISLDWLILDRGPRRFAEIQAAVKMAEETKTNLVEVNDPDTRQLLKNMETDPRLRHEVLLHLFDYKEKKSTPPEPENE